MPLRLLTVTNCQGPVLVQRFLRPSIPDFDLHYRLLPPIQVQTLKAGDEAATRAAIEAADVIVAQPVRAAAVGDVILARLRELAGDKALILFPAMHYDAIFATSRKSSWPGRQAYPFGQTEDQALAALYALGLPPETAVRLWHDIPLYDAVRLGEMIEANLQEFESREVQFGLDVRLSDFYRTSWRKDPLHHVKSHPRASVYEAALPHLAARLGLGAPEIDRVADRRGNDQFELPVKRWVHSTLGMTAMVDFDAGRLTNRKMPLVEILRALWSFYDTVGRTGVQGHFAGQPQFAHALDTYREAIA